MRGVNNAVADQRKVRLYESSIDPAAFGVRLYFMCGAWLLPARYVNFGFGQLLKVKVNELRSKLDIESILHSSLGYKLATSYRAFATALPDTTRDQCNL